MNGNYSLENLSWMISILLVSELVIWSLLNLQIKKYIKNKFIGIILSDY